MLPLKKISGNLCWSPEISCSRLVFYFIVHLTGSSSLILQGFRCGRGRRIRTLNKGFGDPRVTITPCPCVCNKMDYTGVQNVCQAVFTLLHRVRSYIMIPAATAAFSDSAPPRIGSFRWCVDSARTASEMPLPSFPTTRTKDGDTSVRS